MKMSVNLKFRTVTGNFIKGLSGHRCLRIEPYSLFRWNSKITDMFKIGDVKSAQKVFDEMPLKNVVTWNCMISGYIENGMVCEAKDVFDSMPVRNVVSWTSMLSGYAKNGQLEEARRLFETATNKNVACWNSMVSAYLRNGKIEEARVLFDAMPLKNDISCAMMIKGYFKCGAVDEAEALFDKASTRDLLLWNSMLAGYCEAKNVEKAFGLFRRMLKRDVSSWTCMMNGFIKVGEVERGRRLFDEMPVKDTVAWTVMINGYLDRGRIEPAKELFDQMPKKDIVAWNSMLRGYVHNGRLDEGFEFFTRMPKRSIVSWNLMLLGYLHQEDTVKARNFFDRMPKKDETSWNTMISGHRNEEALVLYVEMLSNGFRPNQGTLTAVITICGVLAAQSWGKAMHVFIIKTGHESDGMGMSSLISMYSKCGFIDDASSVFQSMPKRDTVAWNAMIVARAHHYSAREALRLFRSMIDSGCQPDHATFLILLTACAHSGLVVDGWKHLELMKRWDMVPKPEHCAAMVDLLGRLGLFVEAAELANKLPSDIPVYAWESLLSACNIHGNYEVHNLVAEKLSGNRPLEVEMSVLQSNLYAARKMWKAAAQIRAKLRDNRSKKEVGCSWIEVNGSVSCFSYNDKSHMRSEEICVELERLSILIEEVLSS
ncbi:pentatricopeptide repeat-containing protein At4g02750-like [Andrographis paniculata]|uniref:pentatricopeptide repeat-containing protein At4g02750-like n=1 Tax=Andrographis paniculata TaxID=175694 RepID=UPI0021E8A3D5|nr:pentatricopeptide repeat-containing protein At4g02750-like [Andrographis paniculata]